MSIPPFSIFSGVSELFVTAAVFVVVRRNWTRRRFPIALFLAAVLFEAMVNVLYMATRAARAASGAESIPTPMKILFAAHGILSLVAYLVFVVLGVFAWQDQNAGRWYFRDRPVLTWAFLFVWTVSVVSGETLFVLRYLVPR